MFLSKSKKPTRFLALRLPHLQQFGQEATVRSTVQYRNDLQKRSNLVNTFSVGFDTEAKNWATAPLRIYPPSLCKCIAVNVIRAISFVVSNKNDNQTNKVSSLESTTPATVYPPSLCKSKYG